MSQRANVTSVEVLESFRASLIVYASKARPTLEEISAEVIRTRLWIQNDRRLYWEGQVRRRTQKLQDAQQAVFSAELSNLRETTVAEKTAVNKAQRSLDEAEAKLQVVKKWDREFGNRIEPLAKQLERLHTFLANDLPQAVTYLTQSVKTLEAYTGIIAPTMSASETDRVETHSSSEDQSLATTTPIVKESDLPPKEEDQPSIGEGGKL